MSDIIPQAKNKRTIKYIVLHCTAGPQDQTVAEIQRYWRSSLGWKSPGYHFIIKADGSYDQLSTLDKQTNGVAGYNKVSIHLSYIGGVEKGKPVDNRTTGQVATQLELVRKLKEAYPNAVVLGHRDFSTDINGNKIIEQWEWIKSCPCFDVRDWIKSMHLEAAVKPSGIVYKLNFPLIKDSKVKEIQLALNEAGAFIKADGVFGSKTDVALKKFQKDHALKVTGIVDAPTAQILEITI